MHYITRTTIQSSLRAWGFTPGKDIRGQQTENEKKLQNEISSCLNDFLGVQEQAKLYSRRGVISGLNWGL